MRRYSSVRIERLPRTSGCSSWGASPRTSSSGGVAPRRQRRKSATDAEEAAPRHWGGEGASPLRRASEEEDAALASASAALLQARFQAAVATQLSYNDLPSSLYFLMAALAGGPLRAANLAVAAVLVASGAVALKAASRLRSARDGGLATASHAFVAAVALTCAGQVAITLQQLAGLAAAPGRNSPRDPTPAGVAAAHLSTLHTAVALRWLRTQLPPRFVVLPEALRCVVALLAACAYVASAQPGGLSARVALSLTWRAAATALAAPFAVAAFHERHVTAAHLPPQLLSCPAALAPAVDGLARAATRFAAALGAEPVLDAPGLSAAIAGVAAYAALDGYAAPRAMPQLVRRCMAGLLAASAVTLAVRRRAGNATRLVLLQRRLGVDLASGEATSSSSFSDAPAGEEHDAAAALARRLAAASNEHEAVRAALEELYRRFPRAAVCAVATLPLHPGEAAATRFLEAAAARERDRRALLTALAAAGRSSAARAVCARRGPRIAAGADWGGAAAFTDWAAADDAGVAPGGEHFTFRLPGPGGAAIGFAVLVFEAHSGPPRGDADSQDAMLSFASAVGAALGARRAADVLAEQARHLSHAERLVSDLFPAHVAQRLEARRGSVTGLAPLSPEREPRRSTPRVSFAPDTIAALDDDVDGSDDVSAAEQEERRERESSDTLVTHHASVTVVYADVVGFQQLAAQLPAAEALRLLDALWQRFDALAAAHALYKVETSDDSYTAVAGLSPPRRDHAAAALRFALDMHAAAAAVALPGRADGRGLQLRVGLHTGSAASGVLGATRPRFALAGDAVAAARRAEAFDAGAVHLSRAVADACGLPQGLLPERMRAGDGVAWCVLRVGAPEAATVRQLLNEAAAAAPESPPSDDAYDDAGGSEMEDPDAEAVTPMWSDEDEGGPADLPHGAHTPPRGTPERSGFLAGRRSISPPPRNSRPLAMRRSLGADPRQGTPSASPELARKSCGVAEHDAKAEGAAASAAAAADDSAAAEQRRLRTRAGRFMYAHLGASMTAPLGFLLTCALSGGGGGARAGATAACVAAAALLAARRALPCEAALYTPRALAAALWTLAVTCVSSVVLTARALGGDDAAAHRGFLRAISLDPLFVMHWILSGVPARLVWLPELLGAAAHAAFVLITTPSLAPSPGAAALLVLELVCSTVFKLLFLPLFYVPPDAMVELLSDVETWPMRPAALRSARDACIGAVIRARGALLGGSPLLGPHGTAILALHTLVQVVHVARDADRGAAVAASIAAVRFSFLLVCAGGAVVSLRTGAAIALLRQQDDSESAVASRVLAVLRNRIAVARSETAILEAATEALNALFPDAAGVAVGTFAEGSGCDLLAALEVAGPTRGARQTLSAALPLAIGANARSSVSRACSGQPGTRPPLLDSRAVRGGVGGCADWAAASEAGLPTARAITAPLTAGTLVVGFVQLHFGLYSVHSSRPVDGVLARLCDTVGGAIFVRRAFAVNRDAAVGTVAAVLPPRRVPSISRLNNLSFRSGRPITDDDSGGTAGDVDDSPDAALAAEAAALGDGTAAYPATAENAADLAELDATADADRAALLNWALDPAALSDGELRRLTVAMFHSLGLIKRFRLSPAALSAFVDDVAAHMNDVPFHHFRHAFAVTHIAWLFLAESATLRTRLLTEADWLALLLAALCHDLEHPGTTNAFQVNTGSVLAVRYNDASVLESHSTACGWAALVRTRLLAPLPAEEARALRRAMVAAILATDMSAHKTLLAGVEARLASAPEDAEAARVSGDALGGTPAHAGSFSRDSAEDRQLLVAFLLHCADLCNPLLPPQLSRRIADDLSREFAAQAAAERAAGLPVTVMLADGDAAKARMEIGFLDYVVRPLYATLARISPGMGGYCLSRVDANREAWAALAKTDGASGTPRRSPG